MALENTIFRNNAILNNFTATQLKLKMKKRYLK